MTNLQITTSDGVLHAFDVSCTFDIAMRCLDPHDMLGYLDDDTGMMRKSAPCFHDITRGPLHDSEVRAVCSAFAARVDRVGL